MRLIPFQALLDAQHRISPYLKPTPTLRSEWLSTLTGAEVYLKLEVFQPTRSFKVRGALNRVLAMPAELRAGGVITASGGNHGLGVSMAAQIAEIPAVVVLPKNSPEVRRDAIRRLGAEVFIHGEVWNDANVLALEMAEKRGMTYVHPFDHSLIMAGQGTIALELLDQHPDVDVVVASVGGGGLLSGIASGLRHLRPKARAIGVETEGADCMTRSVAAGHLVELEAFNSIADSLGTRVSTQRPLDIVLEAVERMVVVSDRDAVVALFELLGKSNLLVEPAASATAAALIGDHIPDLRGKTVVLVMCGGNTTLDLALEWRARWGV